MKVLVTGASGFVGGYIARCLLAQGYQVRALVRSNSEQRVPKGCELTIGDIGDTQAIRKCTLGCSAVVHSAYCHDEAISSAKHLWVNIAGSYHLLEESRNRGIDQFVFISTISVYDYSRMLYRPVDESHPAWGKSLYAANKLSVEAYCRAYHSEFGLNTTILRLGQVYGAQRTDQGYWLQLAREVTTKPHVKVAGGGMVIAAEDVAEIVAVILDRQDVGGEVYNAVDFFLPWEEYANLIKAKAAVDVVIDGQELPADHFVVSSEKIRGLGLSLKGIRGLDPFIEEMIRLAQR